MKDGNHTVAFAVGNSHTIALSSDGTVYTWGWSDRGQLGHEDRSHRDEPAIIRHFEGSMVRGSGWTAKCVSALIARVCSAVQAAPACLSVRLSSARSQCACVRWCCLCVCLQG
jgi:hypothetical protein